MAIDFSAVIQRMETAQKAANEANEKRYEALLQSIQSLGAQAQGTFAEAQNKLTGLGDTARKRISMGADRRASKAEQDLINRGLSSTTIRGSARRGIYDDAELQQQGVDEMVAGQESGLLRARAGTELQLGGMMQRAIEGRTDAGPNLSLYANLLQQAAGATDPTQRSNIRVGATPRPVNPFVTAGRGGGGSGGGGGASPGGGFTALRGTGGAANGASIVTNPRPELARIAPAAAPTRNMEGNRQYMMWAQANPTAGPKARRARLQEFGLL